MTISLFTMAFNEEIILPHMIKHYRDRFPSCKVVVFDNQSTDKTAEIAKELGCEVIEYNTNNQVDDGKLRNLKNNCWKTATTDWCCVIDADEFLDINEEQLAKEDVLGVTIVRSEAYNMVNMEDNYDIDSISYGTRCSAYDKPYLFKRSVISEMNYVHGAHSASPVGNVKYSDNIYKCYHYININPEITYKKQKYTKERLSQKNRQMGWGSQYFRDISMEEVNGWYNSARSGAQQVKIKK